MSLRVVITLAGKPRGKGRGRAFVHQHTGRVTVMTPEATRTYESQLRYAATQEMAGRPPTVQPVRVDIEARFEVPKSGSKAERAAKLLNHRRPTMKPDWDNLAKICDAMNGVVFKDDVQVVDGRIRKVYAEAPALVVTVETIEPPTLPLGRSQPAGIAGDLFTGAPV